jgi:hypothetical protein
MPSWLELEDELSDESDPDPASELGLESDDTALRFDLFTVRGLVPSSELESELELESGVEGGFVLGLKIFAFSSSSSSSESESELELDSSEDDVESIFSLKACFLFLPSSKSGTASESESTSDSSLESEVDSSEDSSSSSTSSAEDSVLLESRRDSFTLATCGVAFWGASSLSSLLSSETK